jgi:hypothetical protein
MALWGKTDALASAPKYITKKAFFGTAAVSTANSTITLTNSNTGFSVGDGVVYFNGGGTSITGLTSGSTYYVASGGAAGVYKLSATEAGAKAGTGLVSLTGTGNAAQFLQRNAEGNESTAAANGDHINNGRDLYFIDVEEAQQPENKARGLKGPGWWLYRSWTNADGSVAKQSECLIALSGNADSRQATTGDSGATLRAGGSDDAIAVDGTITIGTQPLSQSKVAGSLLANKGVFTVVATLAGAGSLTYQWQVQESSESGATWTNVTRGSGGTTATYTTGDTQVAASASVDSNGDKYRVIVSSTGSTSVTSSTAVLTVTAS